MFVQPLLQWKISKY